MDADCLPFDLICTIFTWDVTYSGSTFQTGSACHYKSEGIMGGCEWEELLTTVNMDYNTDGFYDYYTEEGCASMLSDQSIG